MISYLHFLVTMMGTLPSAQGAALPFSAGLLAGIRLASEPAGDEEEIEEGFRTATRDFPRPDVDPDRHETMRASYDKSLKEVEAELRIDRMALLDMECKRDRRAEEYIYGRFEIDSLSEWTIGAFQLGLVAGARLIHLGYMQPTDSSS